MISFPRLPKPRRAASAWAHLWSLTAVVLAPFVVLAAFLLVQFAERERAEQVERALDMAAHVSDVIDREMESLRAAVEALATSPALLNGDLAAFDAQARDVLRTRGSFIAMRDRTGQQIINTSRPFGAPLPISTDPVLREADAKVFAEGVSVVSDLYVGATTRLQLVLVDVPVRINGEVRYALNIALSPDRLAEILRSSAPAEWTVSLVDRRDRIVARSRQHQQYLGAEASASLRENSRGTRGTWTGVTLEGTQVFSAYVLSPQTGWRASVGIPVAVVAEPLRNLTFTLFGALAFALALSLALSALAARRIEAPLRKLVDAARALGRGEASFPVASGLREVDEVALALDDAARQVRDREADLARAQRIARLGSLTVDLRNHAFRNERSPGYLAIHGLPPDAVHETHEDWVARVHPEDRGWVERRFREAVSGSAARYEVEYRIIRPIDGETRWIRAECEIERDATGAPLRLLGMHRDITEQHAREVAVAESEARLRKVLDQLFAFVGVLTPDGTLLEANSAPLQAAGIEAADVLGRPFWDTYWWSYDAEVQGRLKDACARAAGGETVRYDALVRLKGGALVTIDFQVSPLRDDRGRITHLIASATVIEERVLAEAELRRLNVELEGRVAEAISDRRLWAEVIEAADAYIQVVDPEMRLVAINKANADEYEHRFGVRPTVGDSFPALLARFPEARDAAMAFWTRALSGESFTVTSEFGTPERGRRTYEIKFSPLRDAEGRLTGAYHIAYDVTEREQRRHELAQAQARLGEAQKMETIGQLTGGVAHDFNNLLSAIISNLEIAQKRVGHDERLSRLLSVAMQAAQRGASLTSRLLAFARRQDLKAETVDIPRLFEGMRELLERSLGPAIQISFRFPSRLPPVQVDSNQLELAVLNLAVNARDAMPNGGMLNVSAAVESVTGGHPVLSPGDYVCIRVADTGSGMDEDTLRRATEPFFTTKGVGKGTGLGLSMVHGLALQSGGTLELESHMGQGTTVGIWLPQATAEVRDDTSPSERVRRTSSKALTVLVVDDDPLVAMGTASMLEDLGHTVLEAYSGPKAIEMFAAHPEIDVVVTDYAMPSMTGLDLAERLRRRAPDVPIILSTGYAELPNGLETDLLRLPKPFRQDELARALDLSVRLSEAERAVHSG